MTSTTPTPVHMWKATPLDDLKDLVWLVHDRISFGTDQLGCRDIELTEAEEYAFDGLRVEATKALAKYVPGLSVTSFGLAVYETDEARTAAHTYDDGTAMLQGMSFPEATEMTFTYRYRHDGPEAAFIKRSHEDAKKYAAKRDAMSAHIGDAKTNGCVSAEYVGGDRPFAISTQGGEGFAELNRGELRTLILQLGKLLVAEETAEWTKPE